MAKSDAVWGIDVGNSSLKALRCRPGSQSDQVEAVAFDFIEYPKILTQPGADAAELVSEALAQFQSRNNVRGDRVAISVSGQSGLARFIKLPPVESKRIPEIVRYEARQQIPFALDDVVWDYQRMGGGAEEEGFVLEAEIGLFAMKRDQVFRSLEPLRAAGVEVDFVQLTPLALYNFLRFDQLNELPPADEYDPYDPPPSYVILSMGTDATDLVVTNGYRMWQRSVPLGGNHFTRALTKELKLTFAKAEHLKRNASSAQDPKAVFQAMRPVFNDLLTEIQRSIAYFTSIDRNAKIERVVTLGNGMKLPGLKRYLSQTLGLEVVRMDSFDTLVGPEVVDAPAFKDNLPCFGTSYGLAIQALGKAALLTNLLPQEIVKDRMIRGKKPWAVAAAAALLLGCTISLAGLSRSKASMDESVFGSAEQEAKSAVTESSSLTSAASAAEAAFDKTNQIGQHLVGNVEGRIRWLEMLRAINSCLPSDPQGKQPEDITLRNEVHITGLQCQKWDNLGDWLGLIEKQPWYHPGGAESGQAGATPTAVDTGEDGGTGGEGIAGEGWVITLTGYHYHNPPTAGSLQGEYYVRQTLMANLRENMIQLPKADVANEEEPLPWVTMQELGISHPFLINPGRVKTVTIQNPNVAGARMMGSGGMGYGGAEGEYMGGSGNPAAMMGRGSQNPDAEEAVITLRQFDFEVQFSWQPILPSERQKKKLEQAQAEQPSEGQADQAQPSEA